MIISWGVVPAKSLTLTSAPRLMSSLTCLASPRIAAMWRGVSPRSFLLLTLSFCRDEALLGTFFCTGVVCEGWLGVESGHMEGERKRLKWCSKGRETEKKAHHTLRQLLFSLDWTTTVNPVLLGTRDCLNPCLSKHTCIWTLHMHVWMHGVNTEFTEFTTSWSTQTERQHLHLKQTRSTAVCYKFRL